MVDPKTAPFGVEIFFHRRGRGLYTSKYNQEDDRSQEDEDGDVNMEGDAKPNRL